MNFLQNINREANFVEQHGYIEFGENKTKRDVQLQLQMNDSQQHL